MTQTVMVVEDNAVTRRHARRTLEAGGFHVLEAADGKTALDHAATTVLALVVQDLHLPDIDGFDLLEQLRTLPNTAAIPIIAVTGCLPERASGGAQFSDVLLKPVEPGRLLSVINALVLTELFDRTPREVRRRVLLAEDDLVQRKILRVHLGLWGFDVVEAANGTEALRLAIASPPDIVVSDLLMPQMDGLSLCVALRRDAELADVPIVLLSSYHVDEIDRTLAMHSGATAVVSRSHNMTELQEALKAALVSTASPTRARAGSRSTRDDIGHLVSRIKRDSELHIALAESRATLSALLPFFERFSDVTAYSDVDTIIGELLAGYLDASGAALGCVFLTGDAGLVLRGHLGFRDPIGELPSFFGRLALLEQVLASGVSLDLSLPRGGDIDALLRSSDAVSMVLVPLASRGQPLGVLVLGSRRSSHSTDALRLAEAARGPIAQALALSQSVGELITSRQAFRGIVDSTSDGIVVTDHAARITYANPAAQAIFGYTIDELVGRTSTELMPFLAAAATGVGLRKGGGAFPAAVTVTTFEDTPGHVLRAYVIRDLSLRETLDQLAVLANHDGLTELFNRRRFDEHLTTRIDESLRYNFEGALVMLDLDGFKAINDTHGHQAGDAVLKTVAAALRSVTRNSDFTARIGGDEFAVELPYADLAAAVVVTTKLLVAIGTAIPWHGHALHIGMSAGIAIYPAEGASLDELVASADAALYRSKGAGRNHISTTQLTWGLA